MSVRIPAAVRRAVVARADGRCEYCRIARRHDSEPFQIDHVLPRRHGGRTVAANLALACGHCNRAKGPCLATALPGVGTVRLFDPRAQEWADHFEVRAGRVVGADDVGRATAGFLRMNGLRRVRVRLRSVLLPDPPGST